jgi:4-hydroxybenzoate polyprenyltransferase
MFNHGYPFNRTAPIIWIIRDYLLYSSLYLSIAAGAMAYMSCCLQGLGSLPVTVGIMFLVTYSVYNLNRKTDESEDVINHSDRFSFTKKHEFALYYSAVGAYGFALILALFYGFVTVLITLIPLISGIFYSVPVFPNLMKYGRLKEIPVIKNLIISIAWALPSAILPVYISHVHPNQMTTITAIFFFTLVFINSTVFDMRDIKGDIAAGVETIPILLGKQNTNILLTGINFVLGIWIMLIISKTLPWKVLMVFIFGISYAQLYLLLNHHLEVKNILCDIVADGQFIAFGGLLYILTNYIS